MPIRNCPTSSHPSRWAACHPLVGLWLTLGLLGCAPSREPPAQRPASRVDALTCTDWTLGDRLTVVPPLLEQVALPLTDVSSASNGAQFLVAWVLASPYLPGAPIAAVRLRPDGRPIDTSELRLTLPGRTRQGVRVAFDGTNYVVAWTESVGGGPSQVRSTRVSTSGVVLDPGGSALVSSPFAQRRVGLASNGAGSALAWEQTLLDGGTEVRAGRLSVAGQSLDPAGLVFGTGVSPSIAFGSTDYLVAWQAAPVSNVILGNSLAPNGALGWATPRVLNPQFGSRPVKDPALVYGDGIFLLTSYAASNMVLGNRVSLQGNPLENQSLDLGGYQADRGFWSAFTGSAFVVAPGPTEWLEVSLAGAPAFHTLLGTGTNSLCSSTNRALGTGDQSSCGTAWGTSAQFDRVLTGFWLPAPRETAGCGGTVDEWRVWSQPVGSDRPSLAVAQGRFLVAWQKANGPEHDVWATLFGADEQVQPSFPVSVVPGSQVLPVAASNGQDFLVVWEDHRNGNGDIFAARVMLDGGLLDPGGFAIVDGPAHQHAPSVSYDGIEYVVAWEDERSDAGSEIFAARVSSAGTVLDPNGFIVGGSGGGHFAPRVAPSASGTLVVWQDYRGGSQSDVYAARLSRDGGALDPSGLRLLPTSAYRRSPAAGFDGTQNLVAFVESVDSGIGDVQVVLVHEVDGGLAVGPPASLKTVSTQFTQPEVSFDGRQFVVTWQTIQGGSPLYDYAGINAARVSTTGAIGDDGGIRVVDESAHIPAAALASLDSGVSYVAFKSFRQRAIQVRALRFPPYGLGLPCGCHADCGSGWCVEGVCCDSPCSQDDAGACVACTVSRGAAQDGQCSLRPQGALCGLAPGPCAATRTCDGATPDCPPLVTFPAGTICRLSQDSSCDPAEYCDGISVGCPPDILADAGTPCDDGRLCTDDDACQGGYCYGTRRECRAPCHEGYCDDATGQCVQTPLPDGSGCVDPSTCTEGACVAGACDAGTQFACPPLSACLVGGCSPLGDCVFTPVANGTPCDDANRCTEGDECVAGRCEGVDVCDAGALDAGALDDAGTPDAGTPDAGSDDAGSDDAGLRDAGDNDAGDNDAGDNDAGDNDAGRLDAGNGGSDGGSADGGANEPAPRGCGCHSGGGEGLWLLALLALASAAGRRRASGRAT